MPVGPAWSIGPGVSTRAVTGKPRMKFIDKEKRKEFTSNTINDWATIRYQDLFTLEGFPYWMNFIRYVTVFDQRPYFEANILYKSINLSHKSI